jgi:hypothetical protein
MSILSAPAASLIFNWHAPRRRNLAIAGFIVLSVVLHAAGFYVFQIVYPPTIALLPPPARLTLVTPATEEGRTLLRWVEAEDPALATATQRPSGAKAFVLPKLEHVPSYLTIEPALKEAPPLTIDLSAPSSQPPGPVPTRRTSAVQKLSSVSTSAKFSDELQNLGKPGLPPTKFTASTSDAPESIRFQVAVNQRGEIVYAFTRNSSGDPALDEQARTYLGLCRFPVGATLRGETLVWGTAWIDWGTDVAFPQPAASRMNP